MAAPVISLTTSPVPSPLPLPISSGARLPQLDGIRGLAILLVVIWHYVALRLESLPGPLPAFGSRALGLTWSGVDLFFVLSGFLIGGILLDNRGAPHYFKAFYARRIARIFPLYFAWLAIFGIVTLFVPAYPSNAALRVLLSDGLPFWSYGTFTQNFAMVLRDTYGPEWLGITWSLAIEEQFYALIPLLIRLVPKSRFPFVLFLGITAAPLLRVLLFFVPSYNALVNHVMMPPRADSLLLGVLCAVAVRRPPSAQFLLRHVRSVYLAFGVLFIGAVLLTWQFNTPRSVVMASFGYTWLALFYASFLLLALLDPRGPLARLTLNPLLIRLGILAYGIYLFHEAVIYLAHGQILGSMPSLDSPQAVAVTLLSAVTTYIVARLSWSYFEKPILARGQAVKYENPHTPTSSSLPLPPPLRIGDKRSRDVPPA